MPNTSRRPCTPAASTSGNLRFRSRFFSSIMASQPIPLTGQNKRWEKKIKTLVVSGFIWDEEITTKLCWCYNKPTDWYGIITVLIILDLFFRSFFDGLYFGKSSPGEYVCFFFQESNKQIQVMRPATVDGRNPANQLISSLSHYLQGFCKSQTVQDFFHQP